jgi:hypothetical protein
MERRHPPGAVTTLLGGGAKARYLPEATEAPDRGEEGDRRYPFGASVRSYQRLRGRVRALSDASSSWRSSSNRSRLITSARASAIAQSETSSVSRRNSGSDGFHRPPSLAPPGAPVGRVSRPTARRSSWWRSTADLLRPRSSMKVARHDASLCGPDWAHDHARLRVRVASRPTAPNARSVCSW